MLTCAGSNQSFHITPEFAEHLGGGFAMIHDELLDAIIEWDQTTNIKNTAFYDRLPVRAQLQANGFLCRNFLITLTTLALKTLTPPPATLSCRAEELLLWWSIEFGRECAQHENVWDNQLETLYRDFVELVFLDLDFQFLYSPQYDGIEKVPQTRIGSLSVEHWFLPFKGDQIINPLTWPEGKKYWYQNWKDFEYPE